MYSESKVSQINIDAQIHILYCTHGGGGGGERQGKKEQFRGWGKREWIRQIVSEFERERENLSRWVYIFRRKVSLACIQNSFPCHTVYF